jgi:hypothetical protein
MMRDGNRAEQVPTRAEGIDLGGPGGKRARAVFHAALGASLQDRGTRTAESMQGKLGWFKLRYTNNELQQILDTADRYRPKVISAPKRGDVMDPVTGEPKPVTGNVELTEKGETIHAPRGASPTDLGETGIRSTVLMWEAFSNSEKLVKVGVALSPIVGGVVAFLTAPVNRWAAVAIVVQLWWAAVLYSGWRGETALKAAALAWPRLEGYRPRRYEFETHRWRHGLFPLLEWFVLLLALGGLLLWLEVEPAWSFWNWSGDEWAVAAGSVAALLAVAGIIVHRVCIRPLSAAWKLEAQEVNKWRQAGRPDFFAPEGSDEWVPQLEPLASAAIATPERDDQDELAPQSGAGTGGEL